MNNDTYMGMDVHPAMTVVVVLDAEGKLILETMVPTDAASIIRLVQRRLSIKLCLKRSCRHALEASLEHRVELRENRKDAVIGDSPFAVLER